MNTNTLLSSFALVVVIAIVVIIVYFVTYPKKNGGWSEWSEYTPCTKTCGGGEHTRTRTCTNPVPANGGIYCIGDSTEVGTCNTQPCPINGGWGIWENTGSCSKTCGGGEQTQTRKCNNPVPEFGGAPCDGSVTQKLPCNTQACPVDGGWSGWVDTGSCSKSCGGGVKNLTRTCTNPSPLNGGKDCEGSGTKSVECNTEACPINGGWSGWTDSSTCTKTCGGGTKTQTRSCTNPSPANGGSVCAGSATQTTDCGTIPCPINGGWTDWMNSGTCSKPCEGGLQSQIRTCTNPEPMHGGTNCVGSVEQKLPCNTGTCSYKLQDQRTPANCLYAASMGLAADKTSRTRWTTCADTSKTTYWQFQDLGKGDGKTLVKNMGVGGCLKRPQNTTKVTVVPCDAADTYQHFVHNANGTLQAMGVTAGDMYPSYARLVNSSYTRPPILNTTVVDVWSNDDNAEKFNKAYPAAI